MTGPTDLPVLPDWLQALPLTTRQRLLRSAKSQPMRRGQALFRQGDRATAIWVVLEGWVHLVRSASPNGHREGAVLLTVTPREALCGVSGLTEDGGYTVSGIAGTAGRILRIPSASFRQALAADHQLTRAVLQLCCRRIRRIAEHHGGMTAPVPQRIAQAVLRLRDQLGDPIPVTHRELAQMAWTTTESAIRVIRKFKQQRLCAGRRGELRVRQVEALGRVAGGVL